MLVFFLYYALLAVWPLFLWPAWRLKGWSRAWLLVAAVAGALATAHRVDPAGPLVHTARGLGICLGDS